MADDKSFADRVAGPLKNAGEAIKNAGAKAAENSQAINLKAIDQAEQNAREAFNALRAAAGAKSLSEVMEVQANYIREQSSRGVEQVREIGEMIARFGRDAVSPTDKK
ncbi:phasin family protein [Sphingoaurantiacus capsulatus]|uniref:Phasin family protein n=1 Tax=Sphingoaurantiacus capsulatus TaxID=1771310 RepID=A0ABV7X6Z7_9SPHN